MSNTSKTTSTTSTPGPDPKSAPGAWTADPQAAARAWQDAMLAGIDGLISLHAEVGEATTKQLGKLRAERERLAKLSEEAAEDIARSGIEAGRKTLGYVRDQVERMGRPQPEA